MSCATFKAAILRRPLNASPAMPKIYAVGVQTAVFRPRRLNPCVNQCIKLTENASDASVFSVSLKRSFLPTGLPTDLFRTQCQPTKAGSQELCNTATLPRLCQTVGFELDRNTIFEVEKDFARTPEMLRIPLRQKSDFVSLIPLILLGISVQIVGITVQIIGISVHLYWNTHHKLV